MRLTILLLSLIMQTDLFAQNTYDIFTYSEPKGYKKETKTGTVAYTKTDSKTGTYCIISLYAQNPSSGDLAKDFDNDWKELVVTPLGVTTAPQKDNGDEITGWKTYSGAANFEFSGGTSMALLTTAKKDNSNVAILIVTNSQSFLTTDVDTFFDKLKLGKPKASNTNNNTTLPPNNTTAAPNKLLSDNGIAGVWVSYANLYGGLSNISWNWRVFFSDKKSLSNMPNGGFANLANGEYFDKNKNNVNSFSIGNYSFANGKGSNIKAGAKVDDKLVLEKPNQLKIDGTVFMKCTNVNGQQLSGSFTTFANPNDPAINQTDGFRSVITFTADGKFNDEGIYQVLLKDYSESEDYNAPGKGTYELKDYSIILKFDDGRIKQEALSMPLGYTTGNATIIFIGRAQLNKMK